MMYNATCVYEQQSSFQSLQIDVSCLGLFLENTAECTEYLFNSWKDWVWMNFLGCEQTHVERIYHYKKPESV